MTDKHRVVEPNIFAGQHCHSAERNVKPKRRSENGESETFGLSTPRAGCGTYARGKGFKSIPSKKDAGNGCVVQAYSRLARCAFRVAC